MLYALYFPYISGDFSVNADPSGERPGTPEEDRALTLAKGKTCLVFGIRSMNKPAPSRMGASPPSRRAMKRKEFRQKTKAIAKVAREETGGSLFALRVMTEHSTLAQAKANGNAPICRIGPTWYCIVVPSWCEVVRIWGSECDSFFDKLGPQQQDTRGRASVQPLVPEVLLRTSGPLRPPSEIAR